MRTHARILTKALKTNKNYNKQTFLNSLKIRRLARLIYSKMMKLRCLNLTIRNKNLFFHPFKKSCNKLSEQKAQQGMEKFVSAELTQVNILLTIKVKLVTIQVRLL